MTIVPPQVELGYGMTATIEVTIEVPCTVTGPVKDTTFVTATSQSYDFISSKVTETTFIDVWPALIFVPDREGSSPPGIIYYTHTLTNDGNYTDTIRLSYWNSNGWTVWVSDTVTLIPGQSTVITVEVTVPGSALSGTIETTIITATTMFSDMVNGIPISATVVDTTTVLPFRTVDVAMSFSSPRRCSSVPTRAN